MSQMNTKDGRQSCDHLDLHQAWPQTLECLKATSLAQEANVDRDQQDHLTTFSNLASVTSPGMEVWVATDNLGERVLEFDWHQVARKSLAAGPDSGRNHGLDQRKDFASMETSLADFP